jgi:hypothetical protein
MSESPHRKSLPPGGGIFFDLSLRIRLIARLVTDRRVHPLLKVMPAFGLIYMLVPDLLVGPFDDAALLWVSTTLFVELCPPEVVEEHTRRLMGEEPPDPPKKSGGEDVVDGEYRILDD